jgi:hypothetical protein
MEERAFIALLTEKQAQIKEDMRFCGELPDDSDPVCGLLSRSLQETIHHLEEEKSELINKALMKDLEAKSKHTSSPNQ